MSVQGAFYRPIVYWVLLFIEVLHNLLEAVVELLAVVAGKVLPRQVFVGGTGA